MERETEKLILKRLTSHVSRFTLNNPHGSDVTLLLFQLIARQSSLSNPHGSDGTKKENDIVFEFSIFLTHTVQMELAAAYGLLLI